MKRGKHRSRKGQGLPMNTVIITILVILVLVVVAAFFLGGTSNLVSKIKSIFFGSISGTETVLATQMCQQRCDQLKLLPKSALKSSAYCKDYFHIDADNDGEAEYTRSGDDKQYVQYYCYSNAHEQGSRSLDVPCPLDVTIAGKKEIQQPGTYCFGSGTLAAGQMGPPAPA